MTWGLASSANRSTNSTNIFLHYVRPPDETHSLVLEGLDSELGQRIDPERWVRETCEGREG